MAATKKTLRFQLSLLLGCSMLIAGGLAACDDDGPRRIDIGQGTGGRPGGSVSGGGGSIDGSGGTSVGTGGDTATGGSPGTGGGAVGGTAGGGGSAGGSAGGAGGGTAGGAGGGSAGGTAGGGGQGGSGKGGNAGAGEGGKGGGGGAGGAAGGKGGAGGGAGGRGGAGGSAGAAGGAGGAPTKLVAFYPFNQDSGTVVPDASGNQKDGVTVGNVAFGIGVIQNGLSLDGTLGKYVSVPGGLLRGAKSMTVAFWVRVRNHRPWQRVFDFGSSNAMYMFFSSTTNGNQPAARFAITSSGQGREQVFDSPTPLVAGTWTHIAVVLAPNGLSYYVDGVLKAQRSNITLRPSDLGAMASSYIGRSQFAADPYFDGDIDEFRVYDGALSNTEVSALYQIRSAP